MGDLLHEIIDRPHVFLPLLIAGSILLGGVVKSITAVLTTNSRERTKREIAAYIAEGSMSPEQAEKILRAGNQDPRHS